MKKHGRLIGLVLSLGLVLTVATSCATVQEAKPQTKRLIQVAVEKGDTLASIAKQFDANWHDIVAMNKENLRGGLRVGQVLKIIPGPGAAVQAQTSEANTTSDELDDQDDVNFAPRRKGLLFGGRSQESKPKIDGFIFPVEGSISSYFGKRGRRQHKGIDIVANVGTPIVATGPGEVIFSGRQKGYGSTVVVDHGGMLSLYAHCSKLIARVGDNVNQGDFIAKVGRTGNARGAHLHFEIRDGDNHPVDPVPFLRHKEMAQVQRRMHKKASSGQSLVHTGRKTGHLLADH